MPRRDVARLATGQGEEQENAMIAKPTWKLFECPSGNRWTSIMHDYTGEKCTFSGCGCGGKILCRGATEDRQQANEWFYRLPPIAATEAR